MNLHSKNKEKHQKLDLKSIRKIEHMADGDIVRGKTLDVLEDLRNWKIEKGFFTEKQRKLIRDIEKDYADYPYHSELCDKLVEMFNEGETPSTAESFIRSMIDWFDETHKFTELQLEQIIRIVEPETDFDQD